MSQHEPSPHLPESIPVPTGATHYSAGQSHPEAPRPTTAHRANEEYHAHAVPPRILLGVYFALLGLTFVTVAVTWVHLGNFSIWVALLIAALKAGLVAMYFMHLRWDSPFNGIILIAAFFFVAIFIGIAVMDTHYYAPDYERPGSGQSMSSKTFGARTR